MTQLDLLDLARSTTANEISLFTQVITITFAMIVGIYYFLHQARTAMKVFAYAAYLVGMLLFLGEMLLETNLKLQVLESMKYVPHPSGVTIRYLALNDAWLSTATRVLFNGSFWLMAFGVGYLTFFWEKDEKSA